MEGYRMKRLSCNPSYPVLPKDKQGLQLHAEILSWCDNFWIGLQFGFLLFCFVILILGFCQHWNSCLNGNSCYIILVSVTCMDINIFQHVDSIRHLLHFQIFLFLIKHLSNDLDFTVRELFDFKNVIIMIAQVLCRNFFKVLFQRLYSF